MSLLKKFKRILLGGSEPVSTIKVTEISPAKASRDATKHETSKRERDVSHKHTADAQRDKQTKTEPRARRENTTGGFAEKKRDDSGEKPRYEKPRYEKSQRDDRPRSDKPHADKPYADRPARADKPYADKPREERPRSDRPYSDKPREERPRSDRPYSDKPYGDRPYGDKSQNRRRRTGGRNGKRVDETVAGVNLDNIEVDYGIWSSDEFNIPVEEGKSRFQDFDIPERVMRGIFDAGYQYCTPIQALLLPESFKGTDVSGKAQTGTGKTAAFLITVFKHLLEKPAKADRRKGTPRALIMAPTRELVMQIEKDARVLGKYCRLTFQSVFGGINYEKQRRQLVDKNIDILVATPGRLLDFKEQDVLHLDEVEILVIDEADRMLDMGFIPDMKKIISSTPAKGIRQTMLFSATLTPDILRLASQWTKNPLSFEVESKHLTADAIEQRAYIVTNKEKFAVMYNMIEKENLDRVIVFGNRRDEVSKLSDMFRAAGLACGVLSGDVSQAKRIRTLEDLRGGKIRVLCATDVAARGIHVDDISHVFNFSLPDDPEDYVHRIGRTGRAGASGVSILFATEEDAYLIPRIEKFTGHKLNYINPDDELATLPEEIAKVVPQIKIYSSPRSRANSGAKPPVRKRFDGARSGGGAAAGRRRK